MTGQDDRDRGTAPGGAEFPAEAGWLDLQPPAIGDDFVGRTLARLKDAGVLPRSADRPEHESTQDRPTEDGPPDGAADLPSGLLQAYAPPATRASFVDRALQTLQRDRSDRWRRLLLRYEAPDPTPHFVARTLAALRSDAPASGQRRRPAPAGRPRLRTFGGPPRRWGFLAMTAAAAAVLLLLLQPPRSAYALRELVATTEAAAAPARSPAVLSHLLAAAPLESDVAGGGPLSTAPPDGEWLWLREARR